MPVLRTLTPSNWVGTISTGVAPWSENNEGFGTSEDDQALNSLFNYGATSSLGSPVFKGTGKAIKSTYNMNFSHLLPVVFWFCVNCNIKITL